MAAEAQIHAEVSMEHADPRSGQSLVPMLVTGLVLIVIGMAAVWIFS